MSELKHDSIKKYMRSFDKILGQRNLELLKLSENPDYFRYAEALLDDFLGALNYLCNFRHLTDGFGNRHEPPDVIQKIQSLVIEDFENLTGKKYRPEVCRRAAK